MKICVVSQQANKIISGIGLHTRNLVESLNQAGHEVYLIVPESEKPEWHVLEKVITTPDPFWKKNHARWIPLSWYFNRAIKQAQSNKNFDLIHFTDAREAFFVNSRTPMVGNINDTYAANLRPLSYYRKYYKDSISRWIYYMVVRNAERLTYPRFDALLANSEYTAKTITQVYKVPNSKIHVCYKSISAERFTPNSENIGKNKISRILFVGTNMQRKGLSTLIQAASTLKVKHPELVYWIVGSDPNIHYFQETCKKLGVSDKIQFLGWKSQDELFTIYRQADIFVMPSLDEGFGVAILEAMASGLVVIGSNIGGIPEIITHKDNGLLVEPDNSEELANTLDEIVSNPVLGQKYILNGFETVNKFSIESMMECTYQVYSQVLVNSSLNYRSINK